MPRRKSSDGITDRIQQLLNEKMHLSSALERVEEMLSKVGAVLGASTGKRGRKPAAITAAVGEKTRSGRRRRRRSFETNAEDMVLAFVKSHKNPTTQEINRHWKEAGRGHTADNTLSKLIREKKLKREALKEGRGSRYLLA